MSQNNHFYFANRKLIGRYVNRWDILLLILIFMIIFALGFAGQQMATPYHLGLPLPISLDPNKLPFYALRTILRMFIALSISIIFTFIIGAWAAKNRHVERIAIPTIDILQSVPVLSFLSITVTGFIHLFPNSLLGPEFASIFAIFSAQVWNITLGFYQSLKTVPADLIEASAIFQLSSWQRFWKIEVPFSMPVLLWNMMMSMSASWFFVVLSEAIVVAHQDIRLPGIGSYIALAIEKRNLLAVAYAILTMIVVIFLYDQILFRPLIAWSEKFKMEHAPDEETYQSWLIDWLRCSQLLKRAGKRCSIVKEYFINAPFFRLNLSPTPLPSYRSSSSFIFFRRIIQVLIIAGLLFVTLKSGSTFFQFIKNKFTYQDIFHALMLGAVTGLRVIILIFISSLIWIPIGVWIGLRPRIAQRIQPIIQFAAAFPANLFYPLFVIVIVRYHLNVEVWVTPLMILGTQWYILFNVIAGASTIPRDLYMAANNFGLKGWLWWKRLALPGIFPFYITGAITAAGGAWNASIVAEWVSWGNITLKATGLGEYIQASTLAGNFAHIALGTTIMCLYVLAFNHILWRPLYRLAQERFNISY